MEKRCPVCGNAVTRVVIPSYLGEVYHCDNCNEDFWYCMVRGYCPRCRKMYDIEHKLIKNGECSIIEKLCPNCRNDLGG